MSENRASPFLVENEDGRGPVVLVVDHASNHIPDEWNNLGLDETARKAHIAWDPGALPLARAMSRRLDAPLIHGTVSRLLVDLNRPLTSATLMPKVSETTFIPGNQALSETDRHKRIMRFYTPYHAAVGALVEKHAKTCSAHGRGDVAVVAVHSFTPFYKGVSRTIEAGILFDRDDRLGRGLLTELQKIEGLKAAANEPYSPADGVYFTLDQHAVSRGLLNVMIEIRNNELQTEDAITRWADLLAEGIARTMACRQAAVMETLPSFG